MRTTTRFLGAALAALVALAPGMAMAADGNLPGGTSITVDIQSPSDGELRVSPPGDVVVDGSAAVGAGVPIADTLIVYTLDLSGSTIFSGGPCGNPNLDSSNDSVLDCEVAAALNLNQQAVASGTVGQVGVAAFGTLGLAGDVSPASGNQLVTGPATDVNGNGQRDVEEVLKSARNTNTLNLFGLRSVGPGTNFAEGIDASLEIAAASSMSTKIVVFMSDGDANVGGTVDSALAGVTGVTFHTFAIGVGNSCTANPSGRGSLQRIADLTGGTCTAVPDPSLLPDIIPGVIASQLTALSLRVDGGAPVDISANASQPLPADGPVSVTYDNVAVNGLAPGIHGLCVTASGSDGGGTGSVEECVNVTVATIDLTPDQATNELVDGATHTVTGAVAAGADGGVAGVSVAFDIVSGPNAGQSTSATTDAAGQATFTYAAAQGPAGLGTDAIRGCFSDPTGATGCDTVEKTWQDTTPPVVSCAEGPNPGGKIPRAGATRPGRGSGQNEDGFYVLMATDSIDAAPQIFVQGTSGNPVPPFGPFASGTTVKITEAPGATPSIQPMAGAVQWHIKLDSDANVTAVDASGNSAGTICLVPPPPK
ncbi:MAG TPA: vWA domain-containing protein [Vicinamibacteria bacterium]|nr:vWA domain-containing protein [Vicinamibacteria bacterium]